MLKIALTGGVGAGKTYISKHFMDMGIPVFYADDEAKKLYDLPHVVTFFENHFGKDIYVNVVLNTAKLSSILFSDAQKRTLVNNFIHPQVMNLFLTWAEQQEKECVMMESALIYEAKLESFFDKIIVVHAPLEQRIKRLANKYPSLTQEDIQKRIDAQMPQEEKLRRADFVINNEDVT